MKISTFSPVLTPVGLPNADTPRANQVNEASAIEPISARPSATPEAARRRILERRRQRVARRAQH